MVRSKKGAKWYIRARIWIAMKTRCGKLVLEADLHSYPTIRSRGAGASRVATRSNMHVANCHEGHYLVHCIEN